MPYEAQIKGSQRAYVVLLIDQSGSMETPMAGTGRAKSEEVTDALNRLIYELVRAADPSGGKIKNYYDVSIFGYNESVRSLFSGQLTGRDSVTISELRANPVTIETRENPSTGHPGSEVTFPVWVSTSASGQTHMAQAFAHVFPLLEEWVEQNPRSFPPIVINLTDGFPTDEGLEEEAQRIRSLSTADGQVLVFNLHVSAASTDTSRYPVSPEGLPPEGQRLFGISSELPDGMREIAQSLDVEARYGSRGLVFNGDVVDVIKLFKIGTTPNTARRGSRRS